MITLESLINFEEGQRVQMNPDNHGLTQPHVVQNALLRRGRVVTVVLEGCINPVSGYPTNARTGDITVQWDGEIGTRKYHYRNLRICYEVQQLSESA